MEECSLCMDLGGVDQCARGRTYHASIAYGLLKHGYECCLMCYVRFTSSLFLCGARYAVAQEESPINWVNLAMVLTPAHKGQEALQALTRVRPKGLSFQACVLIESGRAFPQLGLQITAARRLRMAVVFCATSCHWVALLAGIDFSLHGGLPTWRP